MFLDVGGRVAPYFRDCSSLEPAFCPFLGCLRRNVSRPHGVVVIHVYKSDLRSLLVPVDRLPSLFTSRMFLDVGGRVAPYFRDCSSLEPAFCPFLRCLRCNVSRPHVVAVIHVYKSDLRFLLVLVDRLPSLFTGRIFLDVGGRVAPHFRDCSSLEPTNQCFRFRGFVPRFFLGGIRRSCHVVRRTIVVVTVLSPFRGIRRYLL